MCGSPSDPVAEPLGNNICWELDCCLVEEVEERVAVHIVHVEQQDDVRKRVQHPNEVFNSILGNTWPALFNAQWLLWGRVRQLLHILYFHLVDRCQSKGHFPDFLFCESVLQKRSIIISHKRHSAKLIF